MLEGKDFVILDREEIETLYKALSELTERSTKKDTIEAQQWYGLLGTIDRMREFLHPKND